MIRYRGHTCEIKRSPVKSDNCRAKCCIHGQEYAVQGMSMEKIQTWFTGLVDLCLHVQATGNYRGNVT